MKQVFNSEIRKWLDDNPLKEDQELDVHGVPEILFDLATTDDRLKQLNRQIKKMPLQQQKLLLYLSRDLDPALIIESMEYSSPDLFWLDKALLIKEVDPTARKHDVLEVFAINESVLGEIFEVSDDIDREAEQTKSRKYRNYLLVSAPVLLLLVFLFIYPLLTSSDPVSLYEKFRLTYLPDISSVDTTTYSGGSYYEALRLLDEGNYTQSAELFEELIPADSTYRVSGRWFLALINLRNGDKESCMDLLRAIRIDDPVFYKQVADKLLRKL